MRGIDVSNYQPADLTELIARYQAEHVAVRLSTESDKHREIAIAQLRSVAANGCTVSGYIWCYWNQKPWSHIADALSIIQEAQAPVQMIWLDVEDEAGAERGLIRDWLNAALDEVAKRGYSAGIYTGQWFWAVYGAGDSYSHVPLWTAQYDGVPDLDSVKLFGGWARELVWGKQYGADEIDLDVFLVVPK